MQQHSKFKVFISGVSSDTIQRAETEFNSYGIAPKSLGVEYLEGPCLVVLSVGYRDDEPAHPFKITQVSLGQLDLAPSKIQDALEAAAKGVKDVICHEFYVNQAGEFFAVFLTNA